MEETKKNNLCIPIHFAQLNAPQSRRILPVELLVFTPTLPNLVIAATKAFWKAGELAAQVLTVGLDLGSLNRTWSDVKRPWPRWRFWKYALSNVLGVFGSMLMAMVGSTTRGHIDCNWAAYALFKVGSTGF